jgi:thiol:disulfide interchange protein
VFGTVCYMTLVPKPLRNWFIIHFIVDIIFGVPLLFYPVWILHLVGIVETHSVTARLVGAALIGIGSVSFLIRNKSEESYRVLLLLKIVWATAAIVGLLLSFIVDGIAITLPIASIYAIFLVVWIYYQQKLS